MSDEERDKPKRPGGNLTMQIDALRDQVELYDEDDDTDDADDADDAEGEEGHVTAPPPLPPRSTHVPNLAPSHAPAPASTPTPSSKVGVIVIGVVVALVAIGAALFVSGMLVDEPTEVAPASDPSARPDEPTEPTVGEPVGREPETAPALEIGPIEIDTTTAPPE